MRRIDKKLLVVFLVAIVSILAGMGVVQTISSSTMITFTSPTDGGTLPSGTLAVSGTIRASGPIRAFVELSNQGRAAELQLVNRGDHYEFNFTFQDCPDGSYIITVIVVGADGSTVATATIRVTLQGNTTSVTPLPAGDLLPCGVQPCTPPPATCGNPCQTPPPPPPVTVEVPASPPPPPQVVIVHQPPQAPAPPIVVHVQPQNPAPPPIVVFDQPLPPPAQDIRVVLPPVPSAPPPVSFQAPPPPSAPPPVITIVPPPPPPTSDAAPCDCGNGGSGNGGSNGGGGSGGGFPHDSFFDDP